MFKEKYTMDEFEDMFLKAQTETIKELEEDLEEHLKNNEDEDQTGGMGKLAFMMQNVLVTAKLHQKLFQKEEE